MRRHLALIGVALGVFAGAAQADTVVLKTGQAMDGQVIKDDAHGIVLEVTYGTVLIPREKILRREIETPEQKKAREAQLQAERDLAEQMRAEGKVLFNGKWVSEEEKAAAEKKVADAKKKRDDERATAKKKAEEVAAAAKKKAEEERQRQLAAQNNPRDNLDRNHRAPQHAGSTLNNPDSPFHYNSGVLNNNGR